MLGPFAHFNSGVMWINIAGLAAEQSALRDTIRTHLAEAIAPPYDQAALQRHFAGRATMSSSVPPAASPPWKQVSFW